MSFHYMFLMLWTRIGAMNEDTVSLVTPKTPDQNPNSSFAHLPLCQYECSVATINCDVNKKEKMCVFIVHTTMYWLRTGNFPREFPVSKTPKVINPRIGEKAGSISLETIDIWIKQDLKIVRYFSLELARDEHNNNSKTWYVSILRKRNGPIRTRQTKSHYAKKSNRGEETQ